MTISKGKFQIGIDLGTTNTAAAIMTSSGIQMLPLDIGSDLLSSSVYYDRQRKEYVGIEALNRMGEDDGDNGHDGFKRKMGKEFPFPIENLNDTFLAEELSGAVLRRVQEVYGKSIGDQLFTSIVTIPARFNLQACDATRVAGMGRYRDKDGKARISFSKPSDYYADFLYVETLMEPIAASLAYGLHSKLTDNTSWLVYDLGGGTFDAVMVRYIDGQMEIVCSDGDEFLGGMNFDSLLFDHVIREMNLIQPKGSAKTKLRLMCEAAKIDLSKQEETTLELPRLKLQDRNGNPINQVFTIKRDEYNTLVGPKFQRTLNIVSNMLNKEGIDPSSLDRVILVGGSTQYPFFRSQIEHQLGIPIDYSIDPMTAVAQGAAIKAASTAPQEVEDEIIRILSQKPHNCQINLNHESKTLEEASLVTGQIHANGLGLNQIAAVSFARADGGWESGAIPIDEKGFFVSDVPMRDGLNEFNISIQAKGGVKIIPSQDNFSIFKGVGTVGITPHSLNVTIHDGSSVVVIPRGEAFEAIGNHDFWTTEVIKKNTRYQDFRIMVDQLEFGALDTSKSEFDLGESLTKIRSYEMEFREEKGKPDNDEWDRTYNTCNRLLKSLVKLAREGDENDFDDKKRECLEMASDLQKEASDYKILYIEITEGESGQAKDNTPQGKLIIPGTDLRRDLPVDTQLQVEIKQTADRRIFASCYVPFTRQTYQAEINIDRSKVETNQTLSDFYDLDYDNTIKLRQIGTFGDEMQKQKFEELGLAEDLERIEAFIEQQGFESKDNLNGEQYDELNELNTLLTEAKNKIEAYEKGFIYDRLEGRLQYLDTVKKRGGELEQNIPGWRERLEEARNEQSYEKASILEKDLLRFDKRRIHLTLLHHLYGFTNTKENEFISSFNDILNAFRKGVNKLIEELRWEPSLKYSSNIEDVIRDNHSEVNKLEVNIPYFNDMHKKGKFPNLNKMYSGLGTKAKGFFLEVEKDHKYPIRDSSQVTKIFNQYDSRWDEQILADLTKSKPQEEVLKKAKLTAQLWYQDEIEDCRDALDEFLDLFWFDEQTTSMIGSQPDSAQTAPPLTTK